jgi:hypothetical protein
MHSEKNWECVTQELEAKHSGLPLVLNDEPENGPEHLTPSLRSA